eukprot:s2335_g15.t1
MAAGVQTALKLSQEDQQTITALKKEIERAWKMVEASHEKEQRARETIQNLILGDLIVVTCWQEKNDLVKHRDMLQGQVQQMQQQNTDLTAKDRQQGNGELQSLREAFQKLLEEADQQQKRKEKLDKDQTARNTQNPQDLKDMRQGLESKQSEVNARREELAHGEEKQKHLTRLLREERQEEERLSMRAAQLKGNYEHLVKQHKEDQSTLARLKDEQADYKAKVKFRQDEIHALKSSKQKMEKSLEALQSLKDKDDAESRRLEAKTTDMRGQVKKLQEDGCPSGRLAVQPFVRLDLQVSAGSKCQDLDKQKQDSEAHEKQITDLLHERDILGKALMKGDERSKQQAELVELHKGQAITLSKDLSES